MATALVATGRITIPYTVSGQSHKMRLYVRNPQVVGASWNINSRTTDANDEVWTDAAQGMANMLANIHAVGISLSDAMLETRSGSVWTTVATATVTAGSAGGTAQLGSEITLVLRDVTFKKVKVVALDTNEAPQQHNVSPTAGDTIMDNHCKVFLPTHTGTHDPYVWMVGRSNQYLNTAPFVGFTVSFNRKLCKRRGLK